MKVAMILSAPLPPREGIGFYTTSLASQLTMRGHIVHLITRGQAPTLKRWEMNGVTTWEVPFFPLYPYHVHVHNIFVQKLVHELESGLDLLHLHSPLVQLPRTRLPSLVTVHSPIKIASTQLGTEKSLLGLLIKLQAPFSVRLEERLFSHADRLVAVSESVAQSMSEYGIPPERVNVLGNAVDPEVFRPGEDRVQSRAINILTVGRLALGKGLDDLVRCARIVVESEPDVRFLIAGSGPLEKPLRARIHECGMESNVILLGQVSDRAEMLKLYQSASVYLHPSHYEGLPTVVLEAMACARPVIAAEVGGMPDLIEEGVNGRLFQPGDVEEMADAILHLIKDENLMNRLGTVARETIKRSYTWEIVAANYEKEYQALLRCLQ